MSPYQCILAVINPYQDEQPALHRAAFLAEKLNVKLVLASCVYDNSYDMSKLLSSSQREIMKEQVISANLKKLQSYLDKYSHLQHLSCEVIWHKQVHKGILRLAKNVQADLIVKSTKTHNKFAQKVFTPTDWNLLRNSSINVLMVKNHDWPIKGNIVSAVSLTTLDGVHECLSEQVTNASKVITALVNGSLNLVNTFIGAPVHISVEVPQFNPETYNSNVKQHHEELMQALAEKHDIKAAHQFVREGLPEDVIPKVCDELDAELLILGSVGRKGMKAALLGNTAEHIIDKIQCDTLVIKPQSA